MEDKVIIYDDSCPLCKAYTSAFVKAGLLNAEGRQSFSTVEPELLENLDINRSRHEIPLYDKKTGETIYGMDSLFFILGSRWAWMKPIFKNKAFRAVIYQLYQIITFNRRIIAGSRKPKEGFDCAPDFNLKYRLIYIGIAISISILLMLGLGTTVLLGNLACFGLGLGVMLFIDKKVDFIGHWATVMLITELYLLPFHFFTPPVRLLIVTTAVLFGLLLARRVSILQEN